MTMSLSNNAFDVVSAHPLALHRPAEKRGQSRAFAIAVTAAIHVAVAIGLIAGVHVVPLKLPPSLMVQRSVYPPALWKFAVTFFAAEVPLTENVTGLVPEGPWRTDHV